LFCVIVLSVRVEFVQCTFVFVDKRSLSLNKAGFHCFVQLFDTFVYEQSSDSATTVLSLTFGPPSRISRFHRSRT
ncbi:hypothetical protein T10_10658, partial [Trichinella papuae]